MKAAEQTIALHAVEAFQEETGLKAEYVPGDKGSNGPEGFIRIQAGTQKLKFAAEVKRWVNRTTIGLVHRQRLQMGQILLIAQYINPKLANALKDQKIPFMDTAGNAYIKEPPLHVFVKGNKPLDEYKADRTKRLFKPGGLRTLFALFHHPGAENRPYRDLAAEAGVALGTVGWVVNDLKDTGFMLDLGKKGRRLINKPDLLRRWVEAYPEQLRPKLVQGVFTVDDRNWWKHMTPARFDACWGGEVAATKLTGYLKPEKFVLFTHQHPGKLVFKGKLQKDPNGNIEILETFWNFRWKEAERGIAPPLLVYADLMATGDPRNIEAAEMIYDKHLAGLVRED